MGHPEGTAIAGGWKSDFLASGFGSPGLLSKFLGRIHVYNGENCGEEELAAGLASLKLREEESLWL